MKEGDVYIEKEKESQWSNQGEARSCVCIIPLSLSLSFLFHPLSPRNHSSTIPFLYLLIRFILVSLYTIYFYILFFMFVSLFFISYSLLLVFLSIPISLPLVPSPLSSFSSSHPRLPTLSLSSFLFPRPTVCVCVRVRVWTRLNRVPPAEVNHSVHTLVSLHKSVLYSFSRRSFLRTRARNWDSSFCEQAAATG